MAKKKDLSADVAKMRDAAEGDGRGEYVEFLWDDGTMARTYRSDVKDQKTWEKIVQEKKDEGTFHAQVDMGQSPENKAEIADRNERVSLRDQAGRIDAFKPTGSRIEFDLDGHPATVYRGDMSAEKWDKLVESKRKEGTLSKLVQQSADGKTPEVEPEEVTKNPDPRPKEGSRDRIVFKDGDATAVTYRGDMGDKEWKALLAKSSENPNFVRAYTGDTIEEAPRVEAEVGELSRTQEPINLDVSEEPAVSSGTPSARNPASFIPSLTGGALPETPPTQPKYPGDPTLTMDPMSVDGGMGATAAAAAKPAPLSGGYLDTLKSGVSDVIQNVKTDPMGTLGDAATFAYENTTIPGLAMQGAKALESTPPALSPEAQGIAPPGTMPPPAPVPTVPGTAGTGMPPMPQAPAPYELAQGSDPMAMERLIADTEARQARLNEGFGKTVAEIDANSAALATAESQRAALDAQSMALLAQAQENRRVQTEKAMSDYNATIADVKKASSTSIDPNRYWKNQNFASKALAVLGGFFYGWSGKGMEWLNHIDSLIDRDIRSQQADRTAAIESAKFDAQGALTRKDFANQQGASAAEAILREKAMRLQSYQSYAEMLAKRSNNEMVKQNAAQAIEAMQGKIDGLRVQAINIADAKANAQNSAMHAKYTAELSKYKEDMDNRAKMGGGKLKLPPELPQDLRNKIIDLDKGISEYTQMENLAKKYQTGGKVSAVGSRIKGAVGDTIVGGVTGFGGDEAADKAAFKSFANSQAIKKAHGSLQEGEAKRLLGLDADLFDVRATKTARNNRAILAREKIVTLEAAQKAGRGKYDLSADIAEAKRQLLAAQAEDAQ